jgi:Acyl-CoA synthetases (AMP-forming)/AMP-acid ligases II
MNILKLFQSAAKAAPHRAALLHGEKLLCTYGEWLRAVRQRSSWLLGLGLVPGDRLVLCMGNRPEYLELMYAALWCGLTIVPVNAKLHPREVQYILDHCGAKALVTDHLAELGLGGSLLAIDVHALPSPAGLPEAELHPSLEDDVAWLFYTSGTTGRPKGAMLSHGNLLAMTTSYRADVEAVCADDNYVYSAPISHGAGLYTFAYAAAAACHVVPESGGFEAGEVFAIAARLGNVCMFAAPTMVGRLVDQAQHRGAKPVGFKVIVYGGGPMYVADITRAMEVIGPHFAQIYGQGETPMTITCMTRQEVNEAWRTGDPLKRLGSVGRSHSVVEVAVLGEDNAQLPVGAPGEIVVRGPTVMQAYWGDGDATAMALRDGWLYTGDVGFLDDCGFLTLCDRSKDVIISGGSNIYPREVEEVLLEHECVAEASVIGAPDPEWGERIVAFVVARAAAASDAELDRLCVSRIARFKRPKEYVWLDVLPKNNNGKVLKTELRRLYANRAKQQMPQGSQQANHS